MDTYSLGLNFISNNITNPETPTNAVGVSGSLSTGDNLLVIIFALLLVVAFAVSFVLFIRKKKKISVGLFSVVLVLCFCPLFLVHANATEEEKSTDLVFPTSLNAVIDDDAQTVAVDKLVFNNKSDDIASLDSACLYCSDSSIDNLSLTITKGNNKSVIDVTHNPDDYTTFAEALSAIDNDSSSLDLTIEVEYQTAKKLVSKNNISLSFKAAKATPKAIFETDINDSDKKNLIFVCDAKSYDYPEMIECFDIPNEDEGDEPDFPVWWNVNGSINNSIVIKENFNAFRPLNLNHWFAACKLMDKVPDGLQNINTSKTVNMQFTFNAYGEFAHIKDAPNLLNWDTSHVRNMQFLFDCYASKSPVLEHAPDVSSLDTSSCLNFYRCFSYYGRDSHNLNDVPDVSNWDVSNSENLDEFFREYAYESELINCVPDVSMWNTSKVIKCDYMFCNYGQKSTELYTCPDVTEWDTRQLVTCKEMFGEYGCNATHLSSCPNVSKWNTSNLTDCMSMFNSYGYYSQEICCEPNVTNWDTSSLDNLAYMFAQYGVNSKKLNSAPNLKNWKLPLVTSLAHVFDNYGYQKSITDNKENPEYTIFMPSSANIPQLSNCCALFCCTDPNKTSCIKKIVWDADFRSGDGSKYLRMFDNCRILEGQNGTKYDASKINNEYACLDTAEHKGYFSAA